MRITNLRNQMKCLCVDAIIVYKPENRRYISGFTGSTGYALITQEECIFFTDFRYLQQASIQCEGFKIVEISKTIAVTEHLNNMNIEKLGFEDEFMDVATFVDFEKELKNITLVPIKETILLLRAVKDDKEIECIEMAAKITDKAFSHILNFIKPGMTERDVQIELEYFMKKNGASAGSFDFIVASGERSSLPHGVASEKVIELGDFLTLDFGCIYNGYCSDMTRTIIVGKANEKQKEIYNLVLKAQLEALTVIKPDVLGKEIDKVARDVIAEAGYGQYFGHGLGHGVGLEIHELPNVNSIGLSPIKAGMVLTNEPGIYITGFGGVRIEDLVLVTENGYRLLSNSSKELIELIF